MDYSPRDIEQFAARIYQDGRNFIPVPYSYTTTFAALAQNTSQTNSINITANADFVLLELRHRAQIGAAQTVQTKTAPFVRVLITDSGTNEQFTSAAVDLENVSVNGSAERDSFYPRFLAGRTALNVQATNYAPTAETYTTLDLVLSGVLLRVFN